MKIDLIGKLSHFLQTMAFCLAVSAIFIAFRPNSHYEHSLVFSLCIGAFSWLIIDFGRHLYASSTETGWPTGVHGILLPVMGTVLGYVLGTVAADRWLGLSSWDLQSRTSLPATVLMTLISSAAISYYFYTRGKNDYLESKISEVSEQASEAKLKLLQSQLDPHMLFNTLANLKVLINSDTLRASKMLDHLVDYLRSTLNASRATEHPLSAEFDRLKDYLELMTIRMGSRLKYRLNLPTELANITVPSLILQSLVENSIVHGLEPKVTGGTIQVTASRHNQMLTLELSDDGIGFNVVHATDGFGIAQVRDRLITLYRGAATLEIKSSRSASSVGTSANQSLGTHITIHLPL
jgi:sensor histidine kinase YesM